MKRTNGPLWGRKFDSLVQVVARHYKKGEKFLSVEFENTHGPSKKFLASITSDPLSPAWRPGSNMPVEPEIEVLSDIILFEFNSVSDQLVEGLTDTFEYEVMHCGIDSVLTAEDYNRLNSIAGKLDVARPENRISIFFILFTTEYSLDIEI